LLAGPRLSAATRPGRSLIDTIIRSRAHEWLFRFPLYPCPLLQPTTEVGASSPCRRSRGRSLCRTDSGHAGL